ncbi:MAG: hypothetical protein MHM6MM_002624 [Cercozoa sp. M6MM]
MSSASKHVRAMRVMMRKERRQVLGRHLVDPMAQVLRPRGEPRGTWVLLDMLRGKKTAKPFLTRAKEYLFYQKHGMQYVSYGFYVLTAATAFLGFFIYGAFVAGDDPYYMQKRFAANLIDEHLENGEAGYYSDYWKYVVRPEHTWKFDHGYSRQLTEQQILYYKKALRSLHPSNAISLLEEDLNTQTSG